MTNPLLCVCGSTANDVNITPNDTDTSPGGAAYFAAMAATLYLNPVGLVTRIGSDFDVHQIRPEIHPKGIIVDTQGKSASSIQTYHSESDLTDRDIKVDFGVMKDLVSSDIPSAWLKSTKIFHIGTLPPTQQRLFVSHIRKTAPEATISIDTDSIFLSNAETKKEFAELLQLVDTLFVNRHEYSKLESLQTVPTVLVKNDKDGAYILENGDKTHSYAADPVTAVDVTGAGDVFAGVFLACKVLGHNNEDALKNAVTTATKSVTQKGINHLFD